MRSRTHLNLATGLTVTAVLAAGALSFAAPATATTATDPVAYSCSASSDPSCTIDRGGLLNNSNPQKFQLSKSSDGTANTASLVKAYYVAGFGHLEIPSVIAVRNVNYLVTKISEGAEQYTQLSSVTIPNSVTTIEANAFSNTALTSVVIPASVTAINEYAFNSQSLTNVTFLGNAPQAVVFVTKTNYNNGSSYIAMDPGLPKNIFSNPAITTINIPCAATGFDTAGWKVYKQVLVGCAPVLTAVQVAAQLKTAGNFAVLAGAATTISAGSIDGDIGAAAAITIAGAPQFSDGPNVHGSGDTATGTALTDLGAAFAALKALPVDRELANADLSATPITGGVSHSVAALTATGDVTFDARNDPNAIFVIQTDAALNTTASTHMILLNGAQASNIFWVVTGATTLGASSTFDGNILSNAAVTVGASSILIGRAQSLHAAVTLGAGDTIITRTTNTSNK